MLLKVATTVVLLALSIQLIEGFKRVIVVCESDCHYDLSTSDENDRVTRSSSFSNDSIMSENPCCVHDHCSYPSFYCALANLTSNVLINITTDAILSSIVSLSNLTNISISGHNNPTVNCNNSGGLYFTSCNNCTIEGITWEGCGARNISNIYPVIRQFNSSNILIKNCIFQHSMGQAVALYEMSGDAIVENCNFSSNKQYRGHGTTIYYYCSHTSAHQLMFTNCILFSNEGGKSVTYFQQSSTGSLYIKDLKFYQNTGVPIYLTNQNVHIIGNIEFYNNTAENGGGMFIGDHSNVTFHKNVKANFTSNAANDNGGAIFLTNHSSILFNDHLVYHDGQGLQIEAMRVMFHNNTAKYGGAIYAMNSSVIFGEHAVVMIAGNDVEQDGGAVYSIYSTVTFKENSKASFYSNIAHVHGGALAIYNYSNITFKGNSTAVFNNNHAYDGNGGALAISYNCTITCEDNSTVAFSANSAVSGGAVHSIHSIVTFQGNSSIMFNNNRANPQSGGAVTITFFTIITFRENSTVIFNDNSAHETGGAVSIYNSFATFKESTKVTFNVNAARNGTMNIESQSFITFADNSIITFSNNSVTYDGGAMTVYGYSNITFKVNCTIKFLNNSANNEGGAIMANQYSTITFEGNSKILFKSNTAQQVRGGAVASYYSNITFDGHCVVKFISNDQSYAGAVYGTYSMIKFQGNSTVSFYNNSAIAYNGGALFIESHTNITFEGQCTVLFNGNSAGAQGDGGAVMIKQYCNLIFEGSSNVTFYTNKAKLDGGALYIFEISRITFKENSVVTFFNNSADNEGGDIMIRYYSTLTFEGNSKILFNSSTASVHGGAVACYSCSIIFDEHSVVKFISNTESLSGSVFGSSSGILFQGHSTVIFYNNSAITQDGGALSIIGQHSKMTFKEQCTVTFNGNSAMENGGAVKIDQYCVLTFEGNSNVTFHANKARLDGGALYIGEYSNVTFKENCSVTFCNNSAHETGGAVTIFDYSIATIKGNSTIVFSKNNANNGGAMTAKENCDLTVEENPIIVFNSNTASFGGALVISETSAAAFKGFSNITLDMNRADNVGGTIYIDYYSNITFDSNSTISFLSNAADINGGVMYINHHSTFTTKENTKVTCNDNRANFGGSIFLESSNITVEGNSFIKFTNNTALQNGGAIYFSEHSSAIIYNTTTVTFYNNAAFYYGGAIYILPEGSSLNINNSDIYFMNNTARKVQESVYIKLPKSCISKCLDNINIATSNVSLGTSPTKLVLYNAAKCINGSDSGCDTYYMNNIMLGQEIPLVACVMDYYDQPAEVTEFSVTGINNPYYKIPSLIYISVSCNHTTQGISVSGNLHSNSSYNYSITISSYISDAKHISINLMVELTQCHPGFWFSNASQRCECYGTKHIISCSGSSSTIKRGYWFGSVNGKYTVTYCPSEYCNFTCCEIAYGIYHLSPVRANQCGQHRSGIACGNCNNGYTLSFDSPKCVEVGKCTIGQTILITVLSLLYWIVAVVAVFVMTYFNVTIGSLYGIVYYYSVVEILLGQVIFMSNGLYSTINIISSLTKLTPQFLGQLCLVTNMSGIDQQFIHYVHPTIIVLILFVISMLARKSHKISSFVSRGIIQFICFLLLLSYTSIATTSLLLMRPLTFMDINKVYTYLSPDIEYFHGRHLVYGIVAIIFSLVIVIGFPLLLLLEPLLNSKVNFVKIKPLLDQFQGCYKDKYRCFAGYYMVCRLVIILLVIVRTSDNFTTTQYLLISSCALMELIHVQVWPYASTFYNIFDGMMLQLIVIISVLPMVQFINDNYDETSILVLSYLLVILPLATLIVTRLCINKKDIQNAIKDFKEKFIHKYNVVSNDDAEEITEANQFGIVVDDSMRSNATIVDVNDQSEEHLPNIMWCRDTFMENLNEIEALNDTKN